MKINNKYFDRIFYRLRAKKGTVLVSAQEFKNKMHHVLKNQYSIGLASDQNPGVPARAYWMHFFNIPVPFITGPHKAAVKNNMAVIYVNVKKTSRGKYELQLQTITENAGTLTAEALAIQFRDLLEATIKENPDNYLWSHRRWKWSYKTEFANNWIDKWAPSLTK
jgi:KDO2-lipid IV(A) lauroyltransferase